MKSVVHDKIEHNSHLMRAYEKGGKIYADLNSAQECAPHKTRKETVEESLLTKLNNICDNISDKLNDIRHDLDILEDGVNKLEALSHQMEQSLAEFERKRNTSNEKS